MKRDVEHIPFLDHLRGLAILLVFLDHAVFDSFWTYFKAPVELTWNGWFRDFNASPSLYAVLPATLGWTGVTIFFVVSGFCIHLSHERSRLKSWKVFALRRFFRIYPPYLLAMLVCAAAYPLAHAGRSDLPGQVISHALMIFNFSGEYRGGLNASFWSVAVESQLYVLYPLLVWLTARLGWLGGIWITALVEVGLRAGEGIVLIFYPGFEPSVDYAWWYTDFPLAFWFSWSIGAYLAEAYLKKQPLPFLKAPALLWPSLFVVCYLIRPLSPLCFMLAALATSRWVAYLLQKGTFEVPKKGWCGLALEHLRWTGIVSYSLYLIHGPILSQVPRVASLVLHGRHLHPLVIYAFCLAAWPAIFCLAYGFYRLIELPSIAWGKRIIQRLRETPAVPIEPAMVPEKT